MICWLWFDLFEGFEDGLLIMIMERRRFIWGSSVLQWRIKRVQAK